MTSTRLQRGDLLPHLVLRCFDGSVWDYGRTTWQRHNLLLVSLPAQTEVADVIYVDELLRHAADLREYETTWVLTHDSVPGLPCPGLVIADRWGEIYLAVGAPRTNALPRIDEILECLRGIAHECPECQGEAK